MLVAGNSTAMDFPNDHRLTTSLLYGRRTANPTTLRRCTSQASAGCGCSASAFPPQTTSGLLVSVVNTVRGTERISIVDRDPGQTLKPLNDHC